MKTPCFTLNYAAPEVLRQAMTSNNPGDGYDESCDLWSMGVILYAMLSGKAPFQSYSQEISASMVMQRIKEGEFKMTGGSWNAISAKAKDVIKGLLTVDSHERMSISQLIDHPWVQGQLRRGLFQIFIVIV